MAHGHRHRAFQITAPGAGQSSSAGSGVTIDTITRYHRRQYQRHHICVSHLSLPIIAITIQSFAHRITPTSDQYGTYVAHNQAGYRGNRHASFRCYRQAISGHTGRTIIALSLQPAQPPIVATINAQSFNQQSRRIRYLITAPFHRLRRQFTPQRHHQLQSRRSYLS